MATPSIAIIPSAYKAGVLAAVLPNNGIADLDFTRGSSATRVNAQGLIQEVGVNVPRLDYSDGDCPSLLLEPEIRNLLTYSQTFTDAVWAGSTGTLATTTTITPEGGTDAVRVTSVNSVEDLRQTKTITSGIVYSSSCWIRRVSGTSNIILYDVNGNGGSLNVTSEWQRFSISSISTSTNGRFYVRASLAGDVFEVWGTQLEQQSYATSYIPTQGSPITQLAEAASKTGLESYINSSEGVLYAEISALDDDLTFRTISISNGTSSNRCVIRYGGTSNFINVLVSASGTLVFDNNYTLPDITDFSKIALKWKVNDFALWVDGVERKTDTIGSTPIGLSQLQFSNFDNSANPFYGKCKDLRVYTTALSDAELQTLTTL